MTDPRRKHDTEGTIANFNIDTASTRAAGRTAAADPAGNPAASLARHARQPGSLGGKQAVCHYPAGTTPAAKHQACHPADRRGEAAARPRAAAETSRSAGWRDWCLRAGVVPAG
jgi:hypothetical protein